MRDRPHLMELPAGEHALCMCGKSAAWPMCDGSHKGGRKTPFLLKLKEPRKVAICSCGGSGDKPFCDGTHCSMPD